MSPEVTYYCQYIIMEFGHGLLIPYLWLRTNKPWIQSIFSSTMHVRKIMRQHLTARINPKYSANVNPIKTYLLSQLQQV
jgi:hypothetical protein